MNQQTELALLFISIHFRENIKLDAIAESVGLSIYHFHRLFVREQGRTPQQYIEKVRLEHASHFMVLYPHLQLTEVAFECGYSSPACFSRAFKKFYSLSPSAYRSKHGLPEPEMRREGNCSIAIRYLPSIRAEVQKVNLDGPALSDSCQKLSARHHSPTHAIGFFLDVPAHKPLGDCRYYLGTESLPGSSGSTKNILIMPAGYYTTINIKGAFDQMTGSLYNLWERIMASGYVIDSLTGYEKIPLTSNQATFDYFLADRELFIKVRRG